ncbi:hypothetical protein [Hymenobacter endophyticus]|uniref:Periplasmic heavy metal sensor n=1 Tax=Hymenobacter endophyticus TaxID=3076335 RepID=A0ABU3TFN4_9BACT|nr:hypothetical protein [Hymenobacter endophyticus]MDU0370180.1 hypothetical protein [Hymenobacter endophyticus]
MFSAPAAFQPFMKAFFVLLVLIGLSFGAQAQMKDRHAERPGPPEYFSAQAEEVTRLMSDQLHLNEAQIIQMRAINKIKLCRADEIQWQYQDNLAERNAHLAELETQFESECSRILTPSQLSLLRDDKQLDAAPIPLNTTEGGLG